MKRINSLFVNVNNEAQVEWWDNIAKFVRVKETIRVVKTDTNETSGYIFRLGHGPVEHLVKHLYNKKFVKNEVYVEL